MIQTRTFFHEFFKNILFLHNIAKIKYFGPNPGHHSGQTLLKKNKDILITDNNILEIFHKLEII